MDKILGARRVIVVRELLTIRDRGGGELVTLHLLLSETVNCQDMHVQEIN